MGDSYANASRWEGGMGEARRVSRGPRDAEDAETANPVMRDERASPGGDIRSAAPLATKQAFCTWTLIPGPGMSGWQSPCVLVVPNGAYAHNRRKCSGADPSGVDRRVWPERKYLKAEIASASRLAGATSGVGVLRNHFSRVR